MELLRLPLHLLMVAPRPLGLGSLPSLAVTEALFDACEAQGDGAEIEWLWPPSLDALKARLRSEELPAVGVVCLDLVFGQVEEGTGFCFEDTKAEPQIVRTDQLAALLDRVPLVVLRGQSQVQDAQNQSSELLASALVDAGVPCVVCITQGHSVEHIRAAMTTWLAALLAGHPVGYTLSLAQVGEVLRLHRSREDASLIQASPGSDGGIGKVVTFPAAELLPAWRRLAIEPELGGLPPQLPGSFFGRGRELAALERALRSQEGNGIVVVHGYEGVGKTSLVVHAARWLVRSGCFSQVVYTCFAGGGHRELALLDLGARVVGEDFDLSNRDAVVTVERVLSEKPTLVIWDGLDALLEGGEFALGAEALGELLEIGTRIAGAGASRLCVVSNGSRLPDPSYAQASVSLDLPLGGLDDGDALDLLAALLDGIGRESPPSQDAADLLRALGGHPLAICVLSALLAQRCLAEVTATLEEILPGLRAGEARLGNQALSAMLQVFLRSFEEGLRHKLLALGLFASGFMQPLGKAVCSLEEEEWVAYETRLSSARLARDIRLPGLRVPYVSLHPSLSRHLSRRLSPQQRDSLYSNYCGRYAGLLKWMVEGEKRSLLQVSALARYEMPNFRRALRVLLAQEHLNSAIDYARMWQGFLAEIGFQGERARVAKELQEAIAKAVPPKGPLGHPGVQFLLRQGEQMLAARRVTEAGALLGGLCARMEQEGGLSYKGEQAIFDQALALHQLGRCFQASRRSDAALGSFKRSLALLNSLKLKRDVRARLVMVLMDLGEVSLRDGQRQEAESVYQQGLIIAGELKDQRTLGAIKTQLGVIAMAGEEVARAHQLFDEALKHLGAVNDLPGMANVWLQLGSLALGSSDLTEVERCYKQALDLAEKSRRFPLQAQISLQLAEVCERAGHLDDAEEACTQAIRIYQEHNVRPSLASAEMALASLLLREGRLQKARDHAEAVRLIVESLGPGARPWMVYSLLQRIAQGEQDEEGEARWRARGQESFAKSAEAKRVVEQWRPLIEGVAKACLGEALDSENVALLEKLESSDERGELASAIWRVLGGERGTEIYAALGPVDAVVVRRIIEIVEHPQPDEGEGQEESAKEADAKEANGGFALPLPQVIAAVAAAAKGDQRAGSLVSPMLGRMMQEDAPESVRHLAQALARILRGERGDSLLEGLPAEMAAPLQALLNNLGTGNA